MEKRNTKKKKKKERGGGGGGGERERECTFNVTLRRFRGTIVEKQFRLYVGSLRYPVCNGHAPYCHLWPAQLYNIFPYFLLNDMI